MRLYGAQLFGEAPKILHIIHRRFSPRFISALGPRMSWTDHPMHVPVGGGGGGNRVSQGFTQPPEQCPKEVHGRFCPHSSQNHTHLAWRKV